MTTPEEELYVLVCNYWEDGSPYVFGSNIASLAEIRRLQERRAAPTASGKTRIARLQFIEPESDKVKHCNKCGLSEGEWMACSEPDCGELV